MMRMRATVLALAAVVLSGTVYVYPTRAQDPIQEDGGHSLYRDANGAKWCGWTCDLSEGPCCKIVRI